MKPADGKPTAAPCSPPLLQLLDRPIAFHRCFVTLTGSVTAALMLSQAIYWQQRTKDPDGWWYKTRDEWTAETGMKRKEQEGARQRLRKLGILHEDRRGVPATMWYRVDEIRLLELLAKPAESAAVDPASVGTFCTNWKEQNIPTGRNKTYQLAGTKGANKKAPFVPTFKEQRLHRDYAETTTTTPNPSSTDVRAAAPDRARGRGIRNEQTEAPDGGHGNAGLESNEERTVTTDERDETLTENQKTAGSEEVLTARRPELIFPAKLTEQEYEDIAAQVHPLPAEVAQQMLDVLQSQIQGTRIRTNPAAVLRGIVRKYQADPNSFDPSSGFHVADQRRRRAEAEARLHAAAEIPPPRATAPRTPFVRTENQRRCARKFVEESLRSLRGE